METFKQILGFPNYLVSNFGRVKTKSRSVKYNHSVTRNEHFRITEERLLKLYYNNRTGYKFVQLRVGGKAFNKTIHRLVTECFLPYEHGKHFVNHKDGNKHNNTVDNLEWCTNSYNHEHATRTGLKARGEGISTSKLNNNSVHAIKWFLNKGFSHTELSKAFNISRPTISLIAENKIWKHIALTGKELTK